MTEGAKLFWLIVIGMAIVSAIIVTFYTVKNFNQKSTETIEECKKERERDYNKCIKLEIPLDWCYDEIINDRNCI